MEFVGLCFVGMLLVVSTVSGAPQRSTSMPQACVSNLVDFVTCLNQTAVPGGGRPGGPVDIVAKCDSLTAMARCNSDISLACLRLPALKDLNGVFGFSNQIAAACSGPVGRKNMLDLAECNDKIQSTFERCFNFTVIDRALSFQNTNDDFSSMCCVVRNGENCYAPTVSSRCGQKGSAALDAIASFLFDAMQCDMRARC